MRNLEEHSKSRCWISTCDMTLATSLRSRHHGCGLCLESYAINMKKIGIDTGPSNMADLKNDLWLTE
jgi:hypothetical protein